MEVSANTFAPLKSQLYSTEVIKFRHYMYYHVYNKVHYVEGKSMSPLMAAGAKASYTTLQSLLDAEADANAKDELGDTALLYLCREDRVDLQDVQSKEAIREKRQHCFEELISKGADLDVKGSEGMTALMHCARNGNFKIINTLLSKVVDVKAQCDKGRTALMYESAYKDNLDALCLKMLIQESDINAVDIDGNTALIHSVYTNNVQLFSSLIEFNPDINIQNKLGNNAFILANTLNREDILSILLKLNPLLNEKDQNGNTALIKAAMENQGNDHKLVQLLIDEKGIDINAQNNNGETALMIATQRCRKESVQLLISKAADVNIKDVNGKTALKHARLITPCLGYNIDFNIKKNHKHVKRNRSSRVNMQYARKITYNK